MEEDRIERLKKFSASNEECKCLDGTFEEFDKCCGKKHGIENPIGILFSMIDRECNNLSAPRLKDMEPDQAKRILDKMMGL